MQRRQFLVRLLTASALAAGLAAGPVAAASLQDQVVDQLRAQGFTEIRVSRTLLGRIRIAAHGNGYEREIILNPRTGEILRDFWDKEDGDAALISPDERDDDDDGPGSDDAEGGGGRDDDGDDDDSSDDDSSDDGGSDDGGSDDGGDESDDD